MSTWTAPFVERRSYEVNGHEIVVENTFRDLLNAQGQTEYRRLVDRQLLGCVDENEAIEIATYLGWYKAPK